MSQRSWHLPLRTHLLLLVLGTMIPALVVAGLLVRRVVSDDRAASERSLVDVARAQALAVDAEIAATIRALETLSQSTRLDNQELAAFHTIAQRVQRVQPSWLTVILLDVGGHQVVNTGIPFGAPMPAAADPESVRETVATRAPVVGGLRTGPGGRFGVPVRVPVVRDDSVAFVLTAVVTPDGIAELIKGRQQLTAEWTRAVVDGTGTIIARTRDPQRFVGKAATAASVAHFAVAREGVFNEKALDGAEVSAAFSHGEVTGWVSAVAVQRNVLEAPLRRSMLALGGLGLLLLASGGVGVFYISRRVAHDIASASYAAEALAAGRPVTPRPSTVTEVAKLGDALVRSGALLEAHERSRNDYVKQVETARADAEAANRAKDEFLAMLGHELRNPLAPVLTALQLMKMRGDTSSMRERDVIDRQVRHLARLVDDLLDVARLRGGKVQLRHDRFELNAAVQRAVEIASPLISERRHYLLTEVPASGMPIDGDELRIAQVLSNLLTNAAKYTDPGGHISLVATAKDGMAVIQCIDDGTGIAPELKPRLFNLFAQGERAIDRGLGGLGLGLAVARSLTELHGGTLDVDSDGPGKGSRFTVRLPLARGGTPAAVRTEPAQPAGAQRVSRRVLVVDDNRDALEMMSGVLKVAGFTLHTAITAEAALDVVPTFHPDVAVLDIGLPGMNGFDLARALREQIPSIRLAAVTGYGQDSDVAAARDAGFDLHLTKPASMDRLIEFIRG